jgi:type I restriction enzyme, R subunit
MVGDLNEADTCSKFVLPKLANAGWDKNPHSFTEQRSFTDGRVIPLGGRMTRGQRKRADYILRYTHDFNIAVVEAKADFKLPADGLQQAKEYAEILDLKFAYATNGHGIVEFDYFSGNIREIPDFPSPSELWSRYAKGIGIRGDEKTSILTPYDHTSGKHTRYYQEIAINRTVEAILQGRKRILLTMATGTGKTYVAFQICWKLWSSRWNRLGEHRQPKILYLSDRTILVDDPKDKMFAPFQDARWKIENGIATKSRDIYFSTYQAIAEDERRPGLYKEYAPDFFDLIIVDECHRGSARDESAWREILEYFEPAFQLGMTATPQRDVNRDTYSYFGEPIYTYSLRQGIDDGFLAPYRVHRIVTSWDAAGWAPTTGQLDRDGKPIPYEQYGTKEFERIVAMRARTELIAKNLTEYLQSTNRYDKTIIFCVDQEHALEMQQALTNLNSDIVKQHPDYICRVTAMEGDIGKGHLSRFQELETKTPVILTTSRLLTTGVDAPTCKNIVIARVIESMVEFKQIIGRGTRLREDYGKSFFTILDYTGSAIQKFSDPTFDGDPLPTGEVISGPVPKDGPVEKQEKFHVDGGYVTISAHLVYELDKDGNQLRMIELKDYTGDNVRKFYANNDDLRRDWANPVTRARVISKLEERGISLEHLAEVTGREDADAFDLLSHVAFNAPIRTRWDRAMQLKEKHGDFFDTYGSEAKEVLMEILQKYEEHGATQFAIPDILKVQPISNHGNVSEIINLFGDAEGLKKAFVGMQSLMYSE